MPIYNATYIKIIDFNKKIRNVNSKFYKILQDQINRFVPLDNIFLKKFSIFFYSEFTYFIYHAELFF